MDTRTSEVQAIVNIDDKVVNFRSLRIEQEMGEHHDFEVLIDFETFDTAFHISPELFMEQTNTKVVIDLLHADQPGNAYVFSGKVENIRMVAIDGMHGGVVYSGRSNTIELERGEMMLTYSNTNLYEIFETITGGTMNLSVENEPEWKADIDFAIQVRESDWLFLQRLCAQYRENMYYSGTDLIIGRHPEFPTVNLTYDKNLRSFEICSRLVPNRFSTYFYSREEDKNWEQDSPASIEDATNLLEIISGQSDKLTISRKPNTPTPAFVPDMDSLIEHTKRRKVSEGAKMMYCRGESKTCDVRIGRLVSVQMPENMGGGDLGTYRVYKIKHEFDQNGRYLSIFEGVPCDLKYIPKTKVPVPAPQPMEVKIWDNADPEGMGRVRVEFPFDERPCDTWIPVMTFDAGSDAKGSGNVTKNRGTVVLPETGDSCVLGFLDGQELAHPFIMGSIFHGKNTDNQGGGKGNHIKTFTDKAGSFYKFNTQEGSIEVYSKKGNSKLLFDGQGNVSLSTPKTITLTATDIKLNASNSISLQSMPGENGGIGKIDVTAKENIRTNSQEGDIATTAEKGDITLAADKGLFGVSSKETQMKSKGNTTESSGGVFKIIGASNVEINK